MANRDNGDNGAERRISARFDTSLRVDCQSGDNFLFAYIENISEMGIFIRSDDPAPVGTTMDLRFSHDGTELSLRGEVVWINPVRPDGDNINPGMGVHFVELTAEQREQVVELVRTIAYLASDTSN